MIFYVNSCFCWSLSLGTKLIGFFSTFLSASVTVVFGTPALIGEIPETRFIFYTSVATLAAIHFILSCLLVYAAFKETPGNMRIWSVYTCTVSAIIIVFALSGIIVKYLSIDRVVASSGDEEVVASVYFVVGVMLFYFASVVDSQRRKILLSRKRSNDSGATVLL